MSEFDYGDDPGYAGELEAPVRGAFDANPAQLMSWVAQNAAQQAATETLGQVGQYMAAQHQLQVNAHMDEKVMPYVDQELSAYGATKNRDEGYRSWNEDQFPVSEFIEKANLFASDEGWDNPRTAAAMMRSAWDLIAQQRRDADAAARERDANETFARLDAAWMPYSKFRDTNVHQILDGDR